MSLALYYDVTTTTSINSIYNLMRTNMSNIANVSKDKKVNKLKGCSKLYPEPKNVPLYLNGNLNKPCELETEITEDGFIHLKKLVNPY